MTIEIVVIGVTIMVIMIAVITWNLQIDWGHLLNRQRDCSPSDIRSIVSENSASIIQRVKELLVNGMRQQDWGFSLTVQLKICLHQNLWRLKLGLPSSLEASRGHDCCKSRSRGKVSCMLLLLLLRLLLLGVHGPHPQAATVAVRVAAGGSVYAVPPDWCWRG